MAKRTPKAPQRSRLSPAAAKVLPYEGFPLSPHLATGRWYKTVQGKRVYLGPLDDWQGALARWEAERDYHMRGIAPPTDIDGVTVKLLANHFLTSKKDQMEAGDLSPRSWADYRRTCEKLVAHFGAGRLVAHLTPDDFAGLRRDLAKTRGAYGLGSEIQRVRVLMKYGYDAALLDRPIRFGPGFKRPSAKAKRQARHSQVRTMTAAEIRACLDEANVTAQTWILLGINAGYGQSDLAELRHRHVDLARGVISFPRPKTAVTRRCTLWPETTTAMRLAMARRPQPNDPRDDDRCFLTTHGWPVVRVVEREVEDRKAPTGKRLTITPMDAVAQQFNRLLVKTGAKRPGQGFYQLRRTFETVAGETGDQPAVDRIMGHTDESMAGQYREWRADAREDERLRRVTDHVREWLYSDAPELTAAR